MECAECGRAVGPGTEGFATRAVVRTKAGPAVVLCGSCADPGKTVARRWAIMDDRDALASVSTVLPEIGA